MAAILYRVRMPKPHNHRFEIEATFPPTAGALTVALPVWTPGSYLVREFSRHLQQVTAESDGAPLEVEHVDKRSYRVAAEGRAVRFRYSVYANELSVRTSHLDGSHAFFNGANVFLADEARVHEEHRVAIEAPAGWRVSTALRREGDEWIARDYDELVDSPVEIGPHEPLHFDVRGVPHEIAVWGEPLPDPARLAGDLRRICETEAAFFDGLPMERYLFILHLVDKGRGGLEHKASSAILYPRFGLGTPKGWEDFLTLAAHEYFHLWNVKRIRPRALVPYDYAQENYTRLLWFFEGTTSYYDALLTRRAGLIAPGRYLEKMGENISALHAAPGRFVQPLEQASLHAWVKHYRPDENTPNSAISYYVKGEIVSLLLDLEIRRATGDEKSLDTVVRLLWDRHGGGDGVPEDGVERAAAEVAGIDLRPFFERALRSTEELDYSVLSHVGLELRFRPRESAGDRGGTPPRAKNGAKKGWLGATVKPSGTVGAVLEGSPAMEAGLYAGDEVIALDGFKADGSTLTSRCEEKQPGTEVTLTLFRLDRLVEVGVTLGEKPADAAWFARTENPTATQMASFERWIGSPWSEGS